mgnify:CR=1 FL=1
MEVTNTSGRRKTSVSRIYMKLGKGVVTVNKRPIEVYFPSDILQIIVKQPFNTVEQVDKYDVNVNVVGGGLSGQAEATRLAIAKALCEVNEEFRSPLKKEGFLTRDPRMVERKKPGQKKARKSFQFSKR